MGRSGGQPHARWASRAWKAAAATLLARTWACQLQLFAGLPGHGPLGLRRGCAGVTRLAATGSTLEAERTAEGAPDALEVLEAVAKAGGDKVVSLKGRIISLRRQIKDPAEAEEWMAKGNSLQVMPKGQWRRGLTEVEAPDYSQLDEEGNAITRLVELEPDKDFLQNAKLCFKKARKITRGIENVTPMIDEAEESLEQWEARAADAAGWLGEREKSGGLSAASETAVLQLHGFMVKEGLIRKPEPPPAPVDPEEEARKAFKRKHGKDIDCFRSPGGHEVVCGRSSKTNEYVSIKLAKGDMMWFHTDHRIPGSHVLIRSPWDQIADEDIEFAAKIAAYHSKAKNDFEAPVMYCRGDQVKKVKGTKQGQVSISGSKTYQIMVKPGLPEEEE